MSGGCIRAGKKFVSLRNIDLLHRYPDQVLFDSDLEETVLKVEINLEETE